MLGSLRSLLSRVIYEWDNLTLPQQQILEGWFNLLWEAFEREKKSSNAKHGGWFQTAQGMQLLEQKTDTNGNLPMYRVELLTLPQVKKLDTRYAPVLSSTTLNTDVIGQARNAPTDIVSWRLDLWLNPAGECPVQGGIQFVCIRDNQPLAKPRYELDFINGRKLSAFETFFVKSIFDASLDKLR